MAEELICTNADCSGIVDLVVTGTDVTSMNLATLQAVNSIEILSNPNLASVTLPMLQSVTSYTYWGNMPGDGPPIEGLAIQGNASFESVTRWGVIGLGTAFEWPIRLRGDPASHSEVGGGLRLGVEAGLLGPARLVGATC